MIIVHYNGKQVYRGPWEHAPMPVQVFSAGLVEAGYDVAEYFATRKSTKLAMQGYDVEAA